MSVTGSENVRRKGKAMRSDRYLDHVRPYRSLQGLWYLWSWNKGMTTIMTIDSELYKEGSTSGMEIIGGVCQQTNLFYILKSWYVDYVFQEVKGRS